MLLDVLGHLGQNVDEGTAIHIEVSINIILIVIIVN